MPLKARGQTSLVSKWSKFKIAAFTLAEVLITLGIIGIIAEITIPVLIQNVQDEQIKSEVKVAYQYLADSTNTLAYNIGDNSLDLSSTTTMADSYTSIMKVIQRDTVMSKIFSSTYRYYKNYASSFVFPSTWDGAIVVLANGMFLRFISGDGGSCTQNTGGALGSTSCGTFTVDVNGNQKPNMFGKDLVSFHLIRSNSVYKVVPFGPLSTQYTCTATNAGSPWTTNGFGCTEYYILNRTLP